MRHRTVYATWMVALAASMAVTSAQAAFSMTSGTGHCTGTFTIDTTTDPSQVSIVCDGSYTLTDGTITADLPVVITASSIVLDGILNIDVPLLTLVSDTTVISHGAALAVQQPPVLLSPTVPSIASGATITVAQEPPRQITASGSVSVSGGGLQLTASPLVVNTPVTVASGASVPAAASAASGANGGGALDPWMLLGLSAMVAALARPSTWHRQTPRRP